MVFVTSIFCFFIAFFSNNLVVVCYLQP